MSDAAAAELTIGHLDRVARRCAGPLDEEDARRIDEATAGVTSWLQTAVGKRLKRVPEAVRGVLAVLDAATRHGAAQLEAMVAQEASDSGVRQLQTLLDGIAEVCQRIVAGSDGDVVWVEVPNDGVNPVLRVAPLEVASILAERLFATRTAVATSATLTIGGDFALIASQLGLTASEELVWSGVDVGSPFDHARQAILYVAARLPPPTPGPVSDATLGELAELIEAAGGRTLALFSSMRAARDAAERLRDELACPVLLQGDAPLPQLVRRFRAQAETCLFGTLSLWAGRRRTRLCLPEFPRHPAWFDAT